MKKGLEAISGSKFAKKSSTDYDKFLFNEEVISNEEFYNKAPPIPPPSF